MEGKEHAKDWKEELLPKNDSLEEGIRCNF